MKHVVFTNESFEKYIDRLSRSHKFEGRFDDLDLDDVTSSVDIPTQGEVDSAVRELDIFDDAAVKTGAGDVDVDSDGKLRLLDLDDEPKKKDEPSSLPLGRRARANAVLRDLAKQQADAKSKVDPVRELDLDDKGKTVKVKDGGDDAIELDLDEKGKDVKQKASNIGAIGALDYDSDIDTSKLTASIDDVYTALKSDDPRIVKAMIKRYAADIKDVDEIKEILLNHAIKLNLECLKAMCGDMRVALTAKEKQLGFIDRDDIKDALERFKKIACSLTGANNTYGLIPNAIVSCSPDDQIKCMNVIDFLKSWCNLPVIPLYFRGAMIRHLYQVADFLLDELDGVQFDEGFITGTRGLLTRVKGFNDIPKNMITRIAEHLNVKKLNSRLIGDFVIMCLNSGNNKAVRTALNDVSDNKKDMVIDYIDDNDIVAYQKLKKLLKL